MSKILFVDTETSGLLPSQHRIIEIAGVIVDYDESSLRFEIVSEYSRMVKNDSPLDSKITRITSISNEMLALAPSISTVQEEWRQWIKGVINDDEEEVFVCGHSIDFDIRFLTSEKWYLPVYQSVIDTFDLAKILLPDAVAVNLESLIHQYNLSPIKNKSLGEKVTGLVPHRALFDTYCAFLLFEFLINRLVSQYFAPSIIDILLENFLPLNITYYSQKITKATTPVTSNTSPHILSIEGRQVRDFESSFALLGKEKDFDTLTSLIELAEEKNIIRVCLQVYVIMTFVRENRSKKLKFHGRESIDYVLLNTLLELFGDKPNKDEGVVMKYFEDCLSRIEYIGSDNYFVSQFIFGCELLLGFGSAVNSDLVLKINKLMTMYDFLVVQLEQNAVYGEIELNPKNSDTQTLALISRVAIFGEAITDICNYLTTEKEKDDLHPVIEKIMSQCLESINSMKIDSRNNLIIRINQNYCIFALPKREFDLNTYFAEIGLKFSSIILQTYLKNDEFDQLTTSLNLTLPANYVVESLVVSTTPTMISRTITMKLEEYVDWILSQKTPKSAVTIIVAPLAKTYNRLHYYLINSHRSSDFLLVGESGSMSKVLSKISAGFGGIVVLRTSEIIKILDKLAEYSIEDVIFIGEPYLYLKPQIDKFTYEQKQSIKRIYTASIGNKIYTKLKITSTLIPSFT